MKKIIVSIVLLIACFTTIHGQTVTVSTLAGSGVEGHADGQGTLASFNGPHGVAVDASGNVYVADRYNYRIRKISPNGLVSTFAGSSIHGYSDGQGSAASFHSPLGIAIDASDNLYVLDDNRIRKITPSGLVSTFVSNGGFTYPFGIAIDASGNLYVADWGNNKIRKITPSGLVSTFAGSGIGVSNDGQGTAASFDGPRGVAVDASGNVYVADIGGQRIRKITPSGLVSTLAGHGGFGSEDGQGYAAGFYYPSGVAVDASGNIYVADRENNSIRKISQNGLVSTLASYAVGGFNGPTGVAVDVNGNVYVADYQNNKIRKITIVPTGIENINNSSSVSLYPNPTSGIVNLDLGGLKNANLKVYNTLGQLIELKENINTATYQFEINASKGVYFIELKTQEEVKCFKVIKR